VITRVHSIATVLPRFHPGCIAATVAIGSPGWGGAGGEGDAETDGDGRDAARLPQRSTFAILTAKVSVRTIRLSWIRVNAHAVHQAHCTVGGG
jgi:hypothetical protein